MVRFIDNAPLPHLHIPPDILPMPVVHGAGARAAPIGPNQAPAGYALQAPAPILPPHQAQQPAPEAPADVAPREAPNPEGPEPHWLRG